ncbi:Kelch repeat-containing protein [Pontimicrobium aquaticum]|uniref:Galactose oxidase n=1 Tax=Pontimicrobium aquaticum TaxID=2565367 RepID=A0A4U0EYC6_9FLAO|nr:hypothetical protein [Pontimicrobium aquaticum]TJY37081.1 hypothetical protein E5167_03805 [Pontimicrobium aquaticum]
MNKSYDSLGRYMKIKLIVSILLTILSFSSYSQTETAIGVRNAQAMAYNSDESKIYLFGGANHEKVMNDLWCFEKDEWIQIDLNNKPEPRTFSNLVYDSKNERLILFGGNKVLFGDGSNSNTLLNDTWEFKNGQWKKLTTKGTPQPRAEAAMVYDEIRNRVVLFGGYTFQDKSYKKLNDTWEFYENEWHLITNDGPSARNGAAMIFDIKNKVSILFGGSTIDRQYGKTKGETWSWNGKKWRKFKISKTIGIFNAAMVYETNKKEILRFGGWNGKTRINETWVFRNKKWNKLNTKNSPESRNHSFMVYDEQNKRTILFGGHDGDFVYGDIWEFKDYKWKKIKNTKPQKRIENNH